MRLLIFDISLLLYRFPNDPANNHSLDSSNPEPSGFYDLKKIRRKTKLKQEKMGIK